MSAIAIRPEQTELNKEQLDVLRTVIGEAPDVQLRLFVAYCQQTGLDPFARQIYMIRRGNRWTIQTSIDGFRVIAQRTGEYDGQVGPQWAGSDGQWVDVWLGKGPPSAARVGVLRRGSAQPVWGVALWSEFGSTDGQWPKMPAHMLAKVAESHALRKAFPSAMSGLYSEEEMAQAEPVKQGAPFDVAQWRQDVADATDKDTLRDLYRAIPEHVAEQLRPVVYARLEELDEPAAETGEIHEAELVEEQAGTEEL